jgi:gliding motility-associated-like protein/uncharacterized repeat protein (TIGR01451 family)
MLDRSPDQVKSWLKKNVLILLLLFPFEQVFAQIVDPFSTRYQNQQKGGIRILSNASVSCTNCTATTAQIPPAGNGQNNNFTMSYIDVDGQTGTFMSSSDSLNLPNCSEVLWAGLYWSARVGGNGLTPVSLTNYTFRNQVRLRVNNGVYVPLTADEMLDNTVGHQTYHCYKNITPLVQAAGGNARFTVANVVTRTGTNSMYGGWTIVVVYKNVFESMRNLTVFDGLANVSAGNTVTIPITGFLTPLTGPVNFELGVVSHDGDRSQTGDQLQFNGVGTNYVNVSDALHNVNDVFNSTMSRNGVLTPFRIPSFNNSLGHDASVFFPNNSTYNYIGNNATSANIRITTGGETILTSVVTSVIDVYEPDLRATVYMEDLNGGLVQPGDILEYTLVGKNIGSDISNGTFMSDTLDPRTTYLPNSISINYGPNLGPKTDAYGDDQAEYDPINRVVIARIGTGATATAGGVVVNSPTGADSTVVKFRVTVINDCLMFQCDPTLDHKAYIFGTGNISGNAYNNGGLSDLYDANGCPTVANNALLIDVAGCPPAAIDYNDPLCVGETLQLTFPFSSAGNYTWIGPNNFTSTIQNPSIQNVTTAGAGQYTVAVSFNGLDCIIDTTVSVVVNTNPTISLNSTTNVSCFGFTNGALSVAANGTAPFIYSWTNGNNTPNPTGLAAGNYTLTLTDANTCVATASYQVTQPTQLTSVATVTSNYNGFGVSCFGSVNGTASVAASGGVAPYSFLWANGSSLNSAANLPAGNASVTVTDANGCVSTSSAVLNQPTDLVLSHTKVNVSCFGGTNGSIDLSVSGGVTPYTYQWSNGSVTQDLSGLIAGNYTVIVTDANGCTETTAISITQPTAALGVTEIHTDVLCFGLSTGAIDITPSGGTLPYTYLWSNSAITQDLTGIPSGTYTLQLTDANACTASLNVLISQPLSPLQVSLNPVNVLCFGNATGSIDATVSGGTAPYSYSWNNGLLTQDLQGLVAGTYTLITTDANGCNTTTSTTVTQPTAPLSISLIGDDVNCFGASDGSVNATVNGGTLPYSFAWSSGQITEDITSIPVGTYSLIVTDANGCVISDQVILSQPIAPLSGNTVSNQIACFGLATGTIDATVSGGTVPYSFLWSSGQNTEDLSGQLAGSYMLTVTDANGCGLTLSETITQPQNPLTLSETHTDALCIGGLSGTIDLTVSGGTAPYVYSWNNLAITQDISNLQAGVYACTVTDANGCTESISVTILDPSNTMVLSFNTTNVSCLNGANGAIDLTVTGGNPGFTYQWSNQGVTQDIVGLTAGNYAVTVLDNLGCGAFTSAVITEPATAIQSSSIIQDVLCNGFATGSIDMTTQGGVAPYLFTWNSGQQTEDITGVIAGTYILQVTDAAGCVYITTQTVAQPALPISLSETHVDVSCFGGSNGSIDLTSTGGVGNYVYNWSSNQLTEDLSGLIAGSYTVSVTDGNGCLAQLTVSITQPVAPLSLSQLITNVSCNGGNNGAIDVTVSGGTGPYTYSWTTSANTEDITGLISGSYTLLVTDANGCTATITGTVSQPSLLTATSSPTPVSCFAGTNGTASAIPSGGTAPYTYSWSNGLTTALITGLAAGTYTCTITDANGCTVITSAVVVEPSQLLATTSQVDVLCNGNSTGSVTVQATGGVPVYTYLWNTNGTSSSITNLPVGNYSVTVTDANNCTVSVSTTLTQPLAPISATLNVVDNACFNGSIGSIDATVTGGVGPYQYIWSNSQQTEDISGLLSGNFQLLITDANNCQLTVSAFLDQPDQITLGNSVVNNVSCFNGNDGAIDITPIGGTAPYTFLWNNNQTTEDISGLISGAYSVSILDANNCSNQFNFTITQPTQLVGTYTFIEPLCFGYSDGQLTGIANGGVAPYSYSWSNGPLTAVNNQIPTGNYTLLITDDNGCQVQVNAFLEEPEQLDVSYSVSDTIGCDPLTIQLTNTSTEQFNCVWDLGNGSTLNGCDVSYTFDNPGCYDITLTVTSLLGCSNFVQYGDIVCVLPSPTAGIEVNPEWLDSSDPSVEVANTSIGAVSYLWDMGDGSELLTVNQPGLYTYPLYQLDEYTITQIVTAENGCTDTAFYTVEIDNDLLIYVPNTFTPDNDEYNQQFKPVVASQITAYHLSIYNRWGEILFESFDKNVGWDGTYNGTVVQNGTYIWTAVVSTNGTNKIVKNGHVNLIR